MVYHTEWKQKVEVSDEKKKLAFTSEQTFPENTLRPILVWHHVLSKHTVQYAEK